MSDRHMLVVFALATVGILGVHAIDAFAPGPCDCSEETATRCHGSDSQAEVSK